MDSLKNTSGADERQINRRRSSAIRDFEDDLDRARGDLAFEVIRVIRIAVDDVTGDDPSAPADASYAAEQVVRRVFREYGGVVRQAWRTLQRALADGESSP